MSLRTRTAPAAAALLLALCAPAAHAGESYDNCTGFIDTLPAVISTQGVWCLRQDLSTAITEGSAITLAGNNITIDCNGYKLGGLAAGPATQAYGVSADGRLNGAIRNCNIRGFNYGAVFFNGGGHVVDGNRFEGNTYAGVNMNADGAIVSNNLILDTGGSSLNPGAVGITSFDDVVIRGNTIIGVFATPGAGGLATGIRIFSGYGTASDNVIRNLVSDTGMAAYGIRKSGSSRFTFRDNDIGTLPGTVGDGIECSAGGSQAAGNLISGFTVGIDTCEDAGGNDFQP